MEEEVRMSGRSYLGHLPYVRWGLWDRFGAEGVGCRSMGTEIVGVS